MADAACPAAPDGEAARGTPPGYAAGAEVARQTGSGRVAAAGPASRPVPAGDGGPGGTVGSDEEGDTGDDSGEQEEEEENDQGQDASGTPPPIVPPSTPLKDYSTAAMSSLKVDSLSKWIECVCVVNFDTELGQVMETVFPPTVKFTQEETTNICFLAFPDSNCGHNLGDLNYVVRLRKSDATFLYGFVFCRQVKDKELKRGWMQKSIVLLTKLPYGKVFQEVMALAGPLFFSHGTPLLEVIGHNIAAWPPPGPGETLSLPLLGAMIQAELPRASSALSAQTGHHLAALFERVQMAETFGPVVADLWHLWQLVLLNNPIFLVADSPAQSSNATLGLLSLINPIWYCGDYRPYFTIHDSDFRTITAKPEKTGKKVADKDRLPNAIIGVTNPFFFKALAHWPNVLCLSATYSSIAAVKRSGGDDAPKCFFRAAQSRPLVSPDKDVLRALLGEPDSPEVAAMGKDEFLRRHFVTLTENFLRPLERYYTTLMPMQRTVVPFMDPPKLKQFDVDEFLASVGKGVFLTNGVKGNYTELYKMFMTTANFAGWLRMKKKYAARKLADVRHPSPELRPWLAYRRSQYDCDVHALMVGRTEIQTVDLVLKIEEAMAKERTRLPVDAKMLVKLSQHREQVISYLSVELQNSFRLHEELERARVSDPAPPPPAIASASVVLPNGQAPPSGAGGASDQAPSLRSPQPVRPTVTQGELRITAPAGDVPPSPFPVDRIPSAEVGVDLADPGAEQM